MLLEHLGDRRQLLAPAADHMPIRFNREAGDIQHRHPVLGRLAMKRMAGDDRHPEAARNRLLDCLVAAQFQTQVGSEPEPLEVRIDRHAGAGSALAQDKSLSAQLSERELAPRRQGMDAGGDHYQGIGHEDLILQIDVRRWHRHDVQIVLVVPQPLNDAVAILFFVFGVLAGALKSKLEIPPAISKFLSLYLLMALGLKGGFALAHSGLSATVMLSLAAAMLMAFIVPAMGYQLLKNRVSRFDAAAIAASYGSVSAVTFVTAMQYLEANAMPPGGHMAVALVVMESPAIIMAVLLANRLRHARPAAISVSSSGAASLAAFASPRPGTPLGKILHESFTDGAHLLLLGAMAVGCLSGDAGQAVMAPFSSDLFKGMLAFFLLDMGLMVARNVGTVRGKSPVLSPMPSSDRWCMRRSHSRSRSC